MLQLPFEHVLEDWRDREEHADALILLQDNPLLKYAGLWRSGMVQRVSEYACGSTWAELWDCVTVDYELLADMADETEARAKFQVRRLCELRLIYPDGTRTAMATKAVMKFMFDRLG